MFICNRCNSRSNIITVPYAHIKCPVCEEGELVLDHSEREQGLQDLMTAIDARNRAFLKYWEDKREVKLIARFGVRLDNKEDYGKLLRLEYEFNQN